MGILLSISCFLLTAYFWCTERKILSPGVAFSLIWGIILLMSNFQINSENKIYLDLDIVNLRTYFIIIVGVCSFLVGCIIGKKYKFNSYEKKDSRKLVNKKIYVSFLIICVVGGFIKCKASIGYLLRGGAINELYRNLSISTVYISAENTNDFVLSTVESRIVNFIVEPVMFAMIPCSLAHYFKKNEIKYLFIAIMIEMIDLLSHMGRASIMIFAFYVLFFSNYFQKKSSVLKINIKEIKNKLIMLLVVIALIWIFSVRGTQILSTLISYFGYPILHMQRRNELIKQYGNTYGCYSFLGILQLIFGILEKIGVYVPNTFYTAQNYVSMIDSATVLQNGTLYNAFVTIFYSFYVDFGIIGVLIMSLLFGQFCERKYLNFIEKSDDYSAILYALLFSYSFLFSFVRFQFTRSNYALSFVALVILFKNKNKKRRV